MRYLEGFPQPSLPNPTLKTVATALFLVYPIFWPMAPVVRAENMEREHMREQKMYRGVPNFPFTWSRCGALEENTDIDIVG